ncbi:uncharacterized protein si:ch211-197h24.8 [Megalobrama amblycephala]|uniref:uncharacterized protein si:ch211-197h24.8 n=1 Tax=Megalobrama amblycephala TaxID=75352 RepID=UPI0020140637|nr:uncharacterized protein si:ch211-197h24.8 [Megalobrama amblycephala]
MFRTNERDCDELFYKGKHLKLEELKQKRISNKYLYNKRIPSKPEDVEFKVSNLRHDTNLQGYHGIWESDGFKKPTRSDSPRRDLVWWSPDISRQEITIAEEQYLNEQEFEYEVKPFLHRFTSSPAFLASSRMGNFRFSMPIHELLKSYKQQFCEGQKPHIRVFETVVYKQEVMYSIVIHAPHAQGLFSKYPLLRNTQDAVCEFNKDCIIWRPQAMSKTHRFFLTEDMEAIRIPIRDRQNYMWDNIGVAFHVPYGQIFSFSKEILSESLRLCEGAEPKLNSGEFVKCEFDPIRP